MKITNSINKASYLTLMALERGTEIVTDNGEKALVMDVNHEMFPTGYESLKFTYVTKSGTLVIEKYEISPELEVEKIEAPQYSIRMIMGIL